MAEVKATVRGWIVQMRLANLLWMRNFENVLAGPVSKLNHWKGRSMKGVLEREDENDDEITVVVALTPVLRRFFAAPPPSSRDQSSCKQR